MGEPATCYRFAARVASAIYVIHDLSRDRFAPPYSDRCRHCGGKTVGWGKTAGGNIRRRCKACGATRTYYLEVSGYDFRIPATEVRRCLDLLAEGYSIRATARKTGHAKDTVNWIAKWARSLSN